MHATPLIQSLTRLLGIPASRCDLLAVKHGNLDLGAVTAEKWHFQAEPGSIIPCTLYRPRRTTGRLPGIVLTCGHGSSKSVVHMTYVARVYAHAGVACLLADPLGEEERHDNGAMRSRAHDAPDAAYRCELAGRPVMGKFVFDAMRALDFLETLDWIDPTRLGVSGNSLGGAVAGWLFALDPRLRMTIVSGWAFSDFLCRYGKHCTRVPNHKLRAVCTWPEFLALGARQGGLLVLNGDTDAIIDSDGSGTVWRDTIAHLTEIDPDATHLRTWFFPGGGHRPYHGSRQALLYIHEQLGTPALTRDAIMALPELNYGQWCDRHGIQLEPLYGTDRHYRGAMLPDFGLTPIPREELTVFTPDESNRQDISLAAWLKQIES